MRRARRGGFFLPLPSARSAYLPISQASWLPFCRLRLLVPCTLCQLYLWLHVSYWEILHVASPNQLGQTTRYARWTRRFARALCPRRYMAIKVFAVLSMSVGSFGCATNEELIKSPSAATLAKYETSAKNWRPISRAAPIYPITELQRMRVGCVAVGRLVDSNGRVEETEVIKQWPNSSHFAAAAKQAVERFKFEAINENNAPSWDSHIIIFSIEGRKPTEEDLRARCAI